MTDQIKLGLVTDAAPIEEIADGWDFYEIPCQFHIMPMHSEVKWRASRDRYRARGVPTPVASHYIGGDDPTSGFGAYASGPGYDREQELFWASRAFRRMNEIGVKVVGVWGGMFRCPDGYPKAQAWDDAISFCNIVADEGERWGIQIALEPNADPDTLFPSYTEGLKFVKSLGRDAVRLMVDLMYFVKLGESFDLIRQDPEYCLHVQMAGAGHGGHSQTNLDPRTKEYGELFAALKDVGYTGTVSVAAPWFSTNGADPIDWAYETTKTLRYMQDLRAQFW